MKNEESVNFWYYPLYFFLKLIAHLPLPVLYWLSDCLYPVVFYVIRYRKKVVFRNLRNAFPEKTEKEILILARSFYRNFCDVLVETLKMLHFTDKELARHIEYSNPEILLDLYNKGKSVIVVAAHYGNWEWMAGLRIRSPYHTIAVYKPLNSRIFDRIMKQLRTRFGVEVVPMRNILRVLTRHADQKHLTLSCFISDQSPVKEEIQYRTTFLNQDTPVYLGIEKIAAKTNQAVVFMCPEKIRRGYYQVHITLLSENPSSLPQHGLTELHVKMLEQAIRREPSLWLWSHRRWKYSKNA